MSYLSFSYIKAVTVAIALCAILWLVASPAASPVEAQSAAPGYLSFESPQVHPLALTPDGIRLLALNTPGNSLSVFDLTSGLPELVEEIPVGLEPVSVVARNDREAWVANWLSDSVSVVDLSTGSVVRTIDVGDEPTDIVFAGQGREQAFVAVSGEAKVKVYDPASDAPAHIVGIRGKQPRSLSRDPSGQRVFVSVFESGNQTTIVPEAKVTQSGGLPKPSIKMRKSLPKAPEAGLIVKWNGSRWADEKGDARWNQFVPYTLADVDLVVIDAGGGSPSVSSEVRGVGAHVGNTAVDASGRLFVLNTESNNQIRFEPKLRGSFQSSRVSSVDFTQTIPRVNAFDLNPHIDFEISEGSEQERAKSLAMPADIVVAADGTLYIAAMSSAKVGVVDSNGRVLDRIRVGNGPTGLALDESRRRLYALNRFDNTLSVIDTSSRSEVGRLPVGFNPEPAIVREGRLFLYDASLSAHGTVSCSSCHLNGHRDGLAWDLGNPKGKMERSRGLITSNFHPMKGPMATQSLRGIIGDEPLHWRGDRATLSDFNPAFVSLLGGPRELNAAEMESFESFVRTLTYPPNPLQNLDRTMPDPPAGPSAARGQNLFSTSRLDAALLTCNDCHTAVPGFKSGTNKLIIPGPLLQEPQDFKVPQLRGLYQKVGMLASSGEQMSGYGFIHDGSVDTLLSFLRLRVFTFRNDDDRRDVEAFLMAFDSGIAPTVGLQATLGSGGAGTAVVERISLLMRQQEARNCDLIVKGIYQGARRGFVYLGNGMFVSDRKDESQVDLQSLIQAAGQGSLTFTGVPLGHGRRLGIDRDLDGILDGDAR